MGDLKIVDKRYHIKNRLGSGGFSDVYLVEGPQGLSALKILKGEILLKKEDALETFKREFEILKDMRHPNIAAILDFGFDDENCCYYYTSEFIDGQDIFKCASGMPADEATGLIVQTLRALEYIHSYRVHHFDIKPANILVREQGTGNKEQGTMAGCAFPEVKIIDFGLAGIDPRGKLIGTPSYMSPEIVKREQADRRADIYSLGVLWYYILTKTNPFRSPDMDETLDRQINLIPGPPSAVEPNIPKWLDAIVMRMIEKNPSSRFQSDAAVIREINRLGPKKYQLETRETLLSYLPDEGRFIGRAHEIASIEVAVSRVAQIGGLAQCYLVRGEAGTGKTRFIKEIKYRLQLKELKVRYAESADGSSFDDWCAGLLSHIVSGHGMEVFFLDDAGRLSGDESKAAKILSLLARTRRLNPSASALVVLGTGGAPSGELLASLENISNGRIEMAPFSAEELKEYLVSLTGLENPPECLTEGIFRRTEGNPLFVTEVLRSLIERGGLFDEYGRWKDGLFEDVGVDFSKVIVPKTVSDLIIERIKGLPDDWKKILESLSVALRPATAEELGAWADVSSPQGIVLNLVRAGILEKAQGFTVAFQNALMGEVISSRIDSQKKKGMHDRTAAVLRESGAPADEILEHESLGSGMRAAMHASISLGDGALQSGKGKAAAKYFERALSLVAPNDFEHAIEIRMKLGEAHLIAHDYEAAKGRLMAVEESISRGDKTAATAKWRIDTGIRLGGTLIKLREFEYARKVFEDTREVMKNSGGDKRREIVIENFLAGIFFQEGMFKEAMAVFEGTRDASRLLPPDEQAKVTNNDLGMLLVAMKDANRAKKILDEDLAAAISHQDDLLIARAEYNLAQLAVASKDFGAAIESYKRSAEVCRRSGNTELLLCAYNGMGNAYQLSGDHNLSIKSYESGLLLYERIGDLRGGAAIGVNMGLVETARGSLDAALDRIVPAIEYLKGLAQKTSADWQVLARGLLEMGDIYCRQKKFEAAMDALSGAGEIAGRVPQAANLLPWIAAAKAEIPAGGKDSGKLEKEAENVDGILDSMAGKKIREIENLIAKGGDSRAILKTILKYALEIVEKEDGLKDELSDARRRAEKYRAMVEDSRTPAVQSLSESRRKLASRLGRERGAKRGAPKARIDKSNIYDEEKSWKDYERLIISACYAANDSSAKKAANELGISIATMYKRINEWRLGNLPHETQKTAFKYVRGRKLAEYLPLIFSAALMASGNKPTIAIANLRVSQGYFYKVMKRNSNGS